MTTLFRLNPTSEKPCDAYGLLSSCTGPSLENRILAQASPALAHAGSPPQLCCSLPSWASESLSPVLQPTALSCTVAPGALSSALQPTALSCTVAPGALSSALQPTALSCTVAPWALSSSLSNTQSRLLLPDGSLFPLSSSSLLPQANLLLPAEPHSPSKVQQLGGGGGGGGGGEGEREREIDSATEDVQCDSEVCSQASEQPDWVEKEPWGVTVEKAASEQFLATEEEELSVVKEVEFGELEEDVDRLEEELKDKKYLLLNAVCCSLVNKTTAPGQVDWDNEQSLWARLKSLSQDVSASDPQFLLKVAVYTRQELNIRITANFLLALAANISETKPHLRRYFCAAVQLPSDWLEVIRLYNMCFGRSLPSCLKKALVDKFKHFSEYQLAKYNTRKQRCKHNHRRGKAKIFSHMHWDKWASVLGADPQNLQKYLKLQERSAGDKKASVISLKKMIQQLHIREPAECVMGLLGKRYPSDRQAFARSGLQGTWDSERAGKRMRLTQPETWERQLSKEGNHKGTWEKLIDSKSLPFMAMLRNLRNVITAGISQKHHQRILARLTNKESVIRSRQFPFRFLSAYKIIMELSWSVKAAPGSLAVLRGLLKKLPKSRSCEMLDWQTASRLRLKAVLGVPFIYRMFKAKQKMLGKTSGTRYTSELLDRYRSALETAVEISCCHNVPPLPGRTLLLCPVHLGDNREWAKRLDFCCPQDLDPEAKSDALNPSIQETAVLLALMMAKRSEHAQLLLVTNWGCREAELKSDVLLDNVRHVMEQVKDLQSYSDTMEKFCQFFSLQIKVDTIIWIGDDYICGDLESSIDKYRKEIDGGTLFVKVIINSGEIFEKGDTDRNCVKLFGFSEQILKFVAERGSGRLLDHVEHIDKIRGIPPPGGAKEQTEKQTAVSPLAPTPKLRWRGVRVFVSSTFRDMHGERDLLVRSVFPELRRRAAPHSLHVQEVELRWGVTEEEAGRMLELCLSEVGRSQLLISILGERYGLVPPRPTLPDVRQYRWLESAPPGLSVTEMEIRQLQALHPESAQYRASFYFRSSEFLRSVPVAWRADFAPESREAESRMSDLKNRVLNSGIKVTNDYPCEWGGAEDGKPFVNGLEEFGKAVLEDLWAMLMRLYIEGVEEVEWASEATEQELHQEAQSQQCHGRGKLVTAAMATVLESRNRGAGGLVLVQGGPGEGKTVFMAALADALRTPSAKSQKTPDCDVISYSSAASQSARSVEQLLRCVIRSLRERSGNQEEGPLPALYKDLLAEFHVLINDQKEPKRNRPLVLLIDGADHVQDAKGQLISDWIPQNIPKGVSLVLSVTSNSALHRTLSKKKDAALFPLGPLSLPERKEIVQKELAVYGKKLSDSAFNNQLQTLLMKKGAVNPLYLRLACEELRSFAVFEKMKESLQSLPQSLNQLVQHCLLRLQSQYREAGLSWALGALSVSRTGLRERDLYAILNMCGALPPGNGLVTWQEMLKLARKPQERMPMAVFSQLMRSLQSLIGHWHCQNPDDCLTLTNPEVRLAFEELFLSGDVDKTRAHSIMAAHLWVLSDSQGKDTFLHSDANAIIHLPFHLMAIGQSSAVRSLLSSFHFMYAHVRHGLLHHLLDTYSQFAERSNESDAGRGVFTDSPEDSPGDLEACHSFLLRHSPLLSDWPTIFLQQALNEPEGSAAHTWAQGVVGRGRGRPPGGVRVVRWQNNPGHAEKEASKLVSSFLSNPTCVALSPTGRITAVGTGQGSLHIIHTETGKEVRSLVSSCDGISGCVFLGEGLLGATSFDGRIEVWDIDSGCRTAQVDAHSNRITGSDVSADRKHLATVSLDLNLKVWTCPKGTLVTTLSNPCPLNCVTFHPEGQLLAAGGWDGGVLLWNWLSGEKVATLSGHRESVRSLSFSPSASLLSSGSISGEVRLWSVAASTPACVGHYQAHSGSTETLNFLQGGELLLSAGTDSVVQLWSGGLGHSVGQLGESKKRTDIDRFEEPMSPALCVVVAGGFAAVGYHGDGMKLFSVESGEGLWASEDLKVSMHCLVWIQTEKEAELLVSGGGDSRLRTWRRDDEHLELQSCFCVQKGPIRAVAQSSSYLASASDDFTIALWSIQDLTSDPSGDPSLISVLRGHSGGVTCLSFSADGEELLSGGKDRALLVWSTRSSPPSLAHSLLHCHGEWITGCAWTQHNAVSCSVDGRVRLWDVKSGRSVREFLCNFSLTSVCSLGQYVIAGSGDGELLVWNWESGVEITRIPAHCSTIHHCSAVHHNDSNTDQDGNEEDLLVTTASDDGTAKLWRPLQVHHHSTLFGHSGAIQDIAALEGGVSSFLTVSQDRSLRYWSTGLAMESPSNQNGRATALCFSPCGLLVILGYSSGRVEVWRQDSMVCWKQVTGHAVTAVTFLPDEQFAVSCYDCSVSVWRLVWNPQRTSAHVRQAFTVSVESRVVLLCYCSVLLGICENAFIVNIREPADYAASNNIFSLWVNSTRVLGIKPNDQKSSWLLGESDGEVQLGLVMAMGPSSNLSSSFGYINVGNNETTDQSSTPDRRAWTSAIMADKELIVCGDSDGNIWFNQPPDLSSWSKKKRAHSDRVSILRITDTTIISASYDRSVKLWDRQTKKQVGLFVCRGPVLSLEVNPCNPSELVCGDKQGQFYFLSWVE